MQRQKMYRQALLRIMRIKTVTKYHCTTIAVGKQKSPTTSSFGEDVTQVGLSHSAGGRAGALDLTERGWQMHILCLSGSTSRCAPRRHGPAFTKTFIKTFTKRPSSIVCKSPQPETPGNLNPIPSGIFV